MLVFNNQQRSGYEEIASYSPWFYRSIKEMDAVFRMAGFTLDHMAADLERTVSNQFVEHMEEEPFSRYEAFLGVKKDINKTLDERKAYINALLIGSGKFSADKIIAIVNQFVDCECSVQLSGAELYINIAFKNDPDKYIVDIRKFIEKWLPGHLTYRLVLQRKKKAEVFVSSTKEIFISMRKGINPESKAVLQKMRIKVLHPSAHYIAVSYSRKGS